MAECRRPELGLRELLQQRMDFLKGKEEYLVRIACKFWNCYGIQICSKYRYICTCMMLFDEWAVQIGIPVFFGLDENSGIGQPTSNQV